METNSNQQSDRPLTQDGANTERSPFLHESTSHFGPIVGVLITLLILILAGLYLWGSTLVEDSASRSQPVVLTPASTRNEPSKTPASIESLSAVSASDELGAIEQDVMDTDLTAIDAELEEIRKELNSDQ